MKGTAILNQLLPPRFDNTYRGYKVAVWLFGLLVVIKIAMSLNSIFNGYSVASSADGIPLDTFTPAAAQMVVYLVATWGLAHLILSLLCILVLIRYRSMISLMFALLLLELLSRKLVHHFVPTVRTGTPPGYFVNIFLIVVMFVGIALSLLNRSNRQLQN